ncbi:hypothetical protein AB4298_03085 [Shewanella sp. 10N.261.52.F9]|uniref:hypothetical protein n=1 Tax=Shewanella sp. 10N.261.52.F9 TaxID=3229684 RepID=UPI00354FD4E3
MGVMCLGRGVIKSLNFRLAFSLLLFIVTTSVVSSELIEKKVKGFIFKNQRKIHTESLHFAKLDDKLPNKLLENLALIPDIDSIITLKPFDNKGENLIEIMYESRLVVYLKVKENKYDIISVGYSIH